MRPVTSPSRRSLSKRGAIGVAVIVAWIAGLGVLVRSEYFRPQLERLQEAAMRVNPGAVFYGVMQGQTQIGFASSTIDTTSSSITTTDYFVADLPIGGRTRRATVRTAVTLSRALRLEEFDLQVDTATSPIQATGRVLGDSLMLITVTKGAGRPDTQRVRFSGPILMPTLLPLALALGEKPKVGKRYTLPVFDPSSMSQKDVTLQVRAESLFVVNDSSVFDSTSSRWRGVLPDTLHGFQIVAETSAGFTGWIDEQGRIVETTQLGLELRRLPYEVAFENWRMDEEKRGAPVTEGDILESTALAANKTPTGTTEMLRVRLSNVPLGGLALASPRQQLNGDTLTVRREPDATLRASYTLPFDGRRLDPADLRPEPLIEVNAPEIRRLAMRLSVSRNPRDVAARITAWVHDSLRPRVTFGVPSALRVLRSRSGDCNEHTQLFVALARAAGIPARAAAGLAYIDGKFYYHAWPEILLGDWVAVDPTFGQFPADAAHLRFVQGDLARQAELLRLMGNLHIDVLPAPRTSRSARPLASGRRP